MKYFNMQHMQHFPLDNSKNINYCNDMKSYLNASEVAKLLKVDRATVIRWAQQGKLKGAVRIGESHQWRIPIATFEELMKNQK